MFPFGNRLFCCARRTSLKDVLLFYLIDRSMERCVYSNLGTMWSTETLAFEFDLMKGSDLVDISDMSIEAVVFSSQLSPRKFLKLGDVDDVTYKMYINSRSVILVMTPEFLSDIPTGNLTISFKYRKSQSTVVCKVVLGRFVNDTNTVSEKLLV